jgi:fido (protein-threonine AMPylation protein)
MFEEVDARRERLKKHMPLDPQVEERLNAALDPLFIYNSNALEGNTLSLADTIYFIKERRLPGGKKEEEILEVKGQQAAIAYLREAARNRFELSEKLIREFHLLLTEQLPRDKYEPGQYKSRDNMVRLEDGSIFPYVGASETSAAMHDLMVWYRSSEAPHHPIELAAQFHYRFILIHPFLDGNGRTARLLTNLILLLHDYPLGVIIRADSHRERYVAALRAVDSSVPLGDLRPNHPQLNLFPFANFVAQETIWLFDLAIDIIESRRIVTAEDLASRVQRMERDSMAATGLPSNEIENQHALATAVQETTNRVVRILAPMLENANAGLRELSFQTSEQVASFVDLAPPTSYRARVVDPITASRTGLAKVISTSLRLRPGALSGLPVPHNTFEVLVFSELHRLNICTVLDCDLGQGRTIDRADLDSWSGHLPVPLESELFRSTEVSSFLLRELGRFLDIFEGELQRRQKIIKASLPQ